MCARFTLTLRSLAELARSLDLPVETAGGATYRPRYNIAPLQWHWIVRQPHEDRALLPARWGLLNPWAKDEKFASKQINARAETVDQRSAYRAAFQARRCVVPADGCFEWTGPQGRRQPFWFHRPDGGLILFAALYEAWTPAPDQTMLTFTIITTAANATVAPIHDRMPAIVPAAALDDWLSTGERDPQRLRTLLAPVADDLLTSTPVSTRLNSVAHDDPACLSPPEAIPLMAPAPAGPGKDRA